MTNSCSITNPVLNPGSLTPQIVVDRQDVDMLWISLQCSSVGDKQPKQLISFCVPSCAYCQLEDRTKPAIWLASRSFLLPLPETLYFLLYKACWNV